MFYFYKQKTKNSRFNPNYMLPSKITIYYCPVEYHNFLSGKVANILNNNNVKIVFKTLNNSIKTINHKTKKLYTNFLLILIVVTYTKLIGSCNKLCNKKTSRSFKTQYDEHMFQK